MRKAGGRKGKLQEKWGQREEAGREGWGAGENVCVCLCVNERERVRALQLYEPESAFCNWNYKAKEQKAKTRTQQELNEQQTENKFEIARSSGRSIQYVVISRIRDVILSRSTGLCIVESTLDTLPFFWDRRWRENVCMRACHFGMGVKGCMESFQKGPISQELLSPNSPLNPGPEVAFYANLVLRGILRDGPLVFLLFPLESPIL